MAKEIKTIGVMTSGGDAPGMNAAIRAVVRAALSSGLEVKGIRRGYAGLLEEDIIDMHTMSVTDIVQRGGTILFTSRCEEMRTPEGQKKAADICRKHGIDGVVVIIMALDQAICCGLDNGESVYDERGILLL